MKKVLISPLAFAVCLLLLIPTKGFSWDAETAAAEATANHLYDNLKSSNYNDALTQLTGKALDNAAEIFLKLKQDLKLYPNVSAGGSKVVPKYGRWQDKSPIACSAWASKGDFSVARVYVVGTDQHSDECENHEHALRVLTVECLDKSYTSGEPTDCNDMSGCGPYTVVKYDCKVAAID
jgi:hypothetical protein